MISVQLQVIAQYPGAELEAAMAFAPYYRQVSGQREDALTTLAHRLFRSGQMALQQGALSIKPKGTGKGEAIAALCSVHRRANARISGR